jgi:hypothetical protein
MTLLEALQTVFGLRESATTDPRDNQEECERQCEAIDLAKAELNRTLGVDIDAAPEAAR